jgi:hypothetical protein
MRVQVYYNLHKHCWSVKDKSTGRVILHTDSVVLENCKFIVREGGRQKVLREQRKNVHAFVEGDMIQELIHSKNLKEVTYNPYKHDSFVEIENKKPIKNSDLVYMINRKVYCK